MTSNGRAGSIPARGTNINNLKFSKIMHKHKLIKIEFSIDNNYIEVLPTITIHPDEKEIAFHWIIFEMCIMY